MSNRGEDLELRYPYSLRFKEQGLLGFEFRVSVSTIIMQLTVHNHLLAFLAADAAAADRVSFDFRALFKKIRTVSPYSTLWREG